MDNLKNKNDKFLKIFLVIITSLVIIGFIFIYSSSYVYAMEKIGSGNYYLKKQLIGCIIGLVGMMICRYIPLELVKKLTPFAFIGSLLLTCLPLIPKIGSTIYGSRRWILFKGLSFQPSELLKITFILYIAYIISKKKYKVASFTNGFLPLLCIILITSSILLKQPDFGQTVTIAITGIMLYFIAECKTKHIIFTFLFSLPAVIILILTKPYRLKRILIFLNPWEDPQGAGFQIIQSLIAIGSGSIFGKGIAQSKQKFFYLPMQHTDFIFSIIAEETGFIGSIVLITLYIILLYSGIKLAKTLTDDFSYYSVLGFVFLINLQALINLFVATGMVPTKGIGLPFISYGNSALMCNLFMVGLIINFSKNND